MDKFALVVLASLTLAACATPVQTAGTTAGAVGGAVVGGPVGAVVGGATGLWSPRLGAHLAALTIITTAIAAAGTTHTATFTIAGATTSLPACKLSPPIAAAVAAVLGLIVARYGESLDRKKVIAWLKMLENQSAQPRPEDPMGAYDFTWLWRELGVGDDGADRIEAGRLANAERLGIWGSAWRTRSRLLGQNLCGRSWWYGRL